MTALPQLIQSRTVRSGRPPGAVIACSLSDIMFADITVSVVLFFERALDDKRLADGLTRALAHVPVFSGRLWSGEGTLDIVCDDAGVPMATFGIRETLSEAIGRVTLPGAGLVDHVDAPLARAGGQPLLKVRASNLADGGMALGCSWHHAVGDLRSFMLLMRSWSAAVDGKPLPEVLVVQDRDAYLDEVLPATDHGRPGIRLLEADEAAGLAREIGSAIMTGRTVQIYFGTDETSRMRSEFSTAAGRRLSVNDSLCAHIVTSIRQLDDDQETRNLATSVDIRRRLGLPPSVVGNLTNELYLTSAPGTAPEALAAQIRDAVDDFERSHLSIRASRAFLEKVGRSRIRDCVPVGFDLSRRTFTLNSWTRFGIYDLTFEGQRPAYFSPAANVQLPWTSWLADGIDGTGFLYTVVLPARLAARLRTPQGRAAIHRFREPDDVLPALAGTARKLI